MTNKLSNALADYGLALANLSRFPAQLNPRMRSQAIQAAKDIDRASEALGAALTELAQQQPQETDT